MQESLPRPGQDEIDASKAPLLDHLIELRQRLIYSAAAFLVTFLLCFSVARYIYDILVWPYVWASGSDHVRLIATHFLEQIFTHLKLALFGAAFLSFPVVALQIYKFVAPGLYKNERQAFQPYLIATPIFFVLGAAVVYFVAMPVLIKFSIGLAHNASASGPATARVGIVTADTLRRGRRFAIVGIFAVAAVLTPPDAISMVIMAMPTVALYELAIFAVSWVEKKEAAKRAEQDGSAAGGAAT